MKEHPILFTAPMVRAILDGRKTMTRRVMKPQPRADQIMPHDFGLICKPNPHAIYNKNGAWHAIAEDGQDHAYLCPYGHSGDRLWVKETWQYIIHGGTGERKTVYRADNSPEWNGP